MSSSFTFLIRIGYALGLALTVCLLLMPSSSQAQKGFGVSTGYRATPGLPTVAVPILSISTGGGQVGGGGGVLGAGGNVGGGNVSGTVTTQIITVNFGQFFPNNGQIIGLPPPTLMPPLNNLLSDSTAAPWALLFTGSAAAGGGAGGVGGAVGGVGGAGGAAGGGAGGFAGKGMGGFNGKKAL